MKDTIDTDNRAHRAPHALWACSLFVGLCLLLRTSNLQPEFVAMSRALPSPLVAALPRPAAKAAAPDLNAVAHDIGRRFHLAQSAAISITKAAFAAGEAQRIDPTLVLAVAAVESKFRPTAVNPSTGATGLMQVVPKWHQDKILGAGGEPSLLLIGPNIQVGAAILAEYVDAEGGDLSGALGHYLGSTGADRYIKLVRREMAHLARVLDTH